MNDIFLRWITEKRNERNWNDSDLARAMGVDQSNLSKVLNDNRKITTEFCKKISMAFAEPLETILLLAGFITPNDIKDNLLKIYTQLIPERRQEVIDFAEFLLQKQQRETTK